MNIYLNLKEELKIDPYKKLVFHIPLSQLELPEDYIVVDGEEVRVNLHLLKDKDEYIITISLDTHIKMKCDRCLAEYPQRISFSESVILTKKVAKHNELSEEELHTEYLEDEEKFNLNQFVREEIIVNTPMKLLCRTDCRGLCPFCGVDKNIKECDCERRIWKKVSPFSKLQELIK